MRLAEFGRLFVICVAGVGAVSIAYMVGAPVWVAVIFLVVIAVIAGFTTQVRE